MFTSRPRLAAPLVLLAALALMLTAIAPVLAAHEGTGSSRFELKDIASHNTCEEITVDADGVISVNGTALTEAQLPLIDAEVLAALTLAAAADASGAGDVCVDVAITGDAITVNGDIAFCPAAVVVDGEGTVTLGGVEIDPALLTAEQLVVLQAAADADIEACVIVVVEENDVAAIVFFEACVTATLNEDGTVTVDLGAAQIELPAGGIIDSEVDLEVDVATEIGLVIFAVQEGFGTPVTFGAQVIELEDCAQVAPSPEPTVAPTFAPTAAPTGAPTDAVAPTNVVQPTFNITQPPTDGTVAVNGQASAQMLAPVVLLVVIAGGLLGLQARRGRTR